MVCAVNKIDSNITSLAYAEEVCLKQLPGVAGADAIWYGLEPNSYSDFGGQISTVARAPIDPSRQNKKGTVTDLNASGGFNFDFTQSNFVRLAQGFFFADAREKPKTAGLNAAALPLTSVTGSSKTYAAASGLAVFNKAGYLVKASGFGVASNNGVKTVASATGTTVVVSETIIDEASPPAAATLEVIGFKFPTADVSISVTGSIPSLVSAATNLTTLGLIVGEWIFIGADGTGNSFANNVGFARISAISTTTLTFDDVTWASPATEAGTGKTISIYFGTVIKNESTASLIKRRSYNIERQLGIGEFAGIQAEYLEGAVANEFSLKIPQAAKLEADLTFVACDNTQRTGDVTDQIKAGTRVPALGEDAFNTSSNVYRIKLNVLDPLTASPTPLFGYVTEANLSIKNSVTPNKAVGVLGAIDTSAGNFEVSGTLTAYFSTIAAVKAVRTNADVGLSAICTAKNAGFLFDIPLLGLGGGRINVQKDNPVTVPLEPAGAMNKNGYTMLYNVYSYLPTLAMPK